MFIQLEKPETEERGDWIMPGITEFYQNRIYATRNYPLHSARGILLTVIHCVENDECLTEEERLIIIDKAITEIQWREIKEEEKKEEENDKICLCL